MVEWIFPKWLIEMNVKQPISHSLSRGAMLYLGYQKKGVTVMETTLGKRIGMLRRQKGLKQDELAEKLGVSPQAVSKWENDQTCPDISRLPELARMLEVSVDELLSGKRESTPVVQIVPEPQRKDIRDMTLRIVVDSADGDKVRVNLPMALLQIAIDTGMGMPQINGGRAMQNIDWNQIMELIRQGAVGNLVEVESEGDFVRIFVE